MEDMTFDDLILESAQSITKATSSLMKAATAAQKELVSQGRGHPGSSQPGGPLESTGSPREAAQTEDRGRGQASVVPGTAASSKHSNLVSSKYFILAYIIQGIS